ncbi:MAG: hypothetical protein JXB17_01185 [Bacteroidales bacterium]|nr:hypothetical protein [Bacteroidales bacterium]
MQTYQIKKNRLKNNALIAINCIMALCIISCEKDNDTPGLLTKVEGIVTDYYTNEPIAGIKLKITNDTSDICFAPQCMVAEKYDTIYTNNNGKYYYEFYNDTNRTYKIRTLMDSLYYHSIYDSVIVEGKKNSINFKVKPYRKLTLSIINKTNQFMFFDAQNHMAENERFEIEGYDINKRIHLRVVPENNNLIGIHLYNLNNDQYKNDGLDFYLSNTDTSITYKY